MRLAFPHGIGADDVQSIRTKVQEEGRRLGLPPQSGFILLFVVDELCCNVMEHSKAAWTEIEIFADQKGFRFVLKDDGIPFNIQAEVKAVAGKALQDQMDDRHVGLSLIGRLVDRLEYQRTPEGLNFLELTKAW